MRPYSPGGALNTFASAKRASNLLDLVRIVYGVDYRVSNPVCYQRFRPSASEQAQWPDFSVGVPIDIYAFHRSTYRSDHLYLPQDVQFTKQFPG